MEERENFYRFSALLLDVGTRVLREVFTFHHLSSNTLVAYLSLNKKHLMQLPENVLRQGQRNKLFPLSGKCALIEDFDITLLCVLFRNLDSNISSKDPVWSGPSLTDISFQADVGRIRVIRNALFAHVSSLSLDNTSFKRETINLTTIYKRLISPIPATQFAPKDLQLMIDKELTGPLQPDLENEIKKMRAKIEDWQRYDEDVIQILIKIKADVQEVLDVQRESIEVKKQWDSRSKGEKIFIDRTQQQKRIDLSQTLLERHRSHAEKNFIETQAYRDANKRLLQHRKLIITGKSGQGKTYLACQLLSKIMADNSDIRPLIVSTAEQWRTLVDSSTTLGVIVDDMCGRLCVNEEIKQWREESTYMPGLIDNGKHVVIFTIKSHLQEKILEAIEPISSSEEILLELDTICLTLAEKKEFAIRYLKMFGLNEAEVSDLCEIHEVPVGFPQMCRTAEMITDKSKLLDLFSKPREMMLKQMKHFQHYDEMAYSCLVFVMLSEGKLNLQSVRDLGDSSKRSENKVISVFNLFGFSDVTPAEVLERLQTLANNYISFNATEESYFFSHDSIEEAVFISYAKMYPQETLLYCPLELICKCCIIHYESKVLEKTTEDNILIVPPSCQAIMTKRFITALRGSNPIDFTIISEAKVWSSKEFRKAFIAECKEVHYLADIDENSLLVHAANANNRDLVEELLHELDNISVDKRKTVAHFLAKSAKSSCAHKDTYLLEKICEKGNVDVNDILPNIIEQGSVDAIEFLLQSGADLNYRSRNGENLLHIASLHGRLDIVHLLHSRNANLVKEFDHNKRSVIHSAACGGSVNILEFLLSLDLNLLRTDSTGWNLLHYACWYANKDMVEYLLDKHPCLLSSRTDEGMSALLCAAFGGNIYIFKKMYELESLLRDGHNDNSDVNGVNSENFMKQTTAQKTLLHMSCLGGSLEMTKYLVETYPKMLHVVDNGKRTPAHSAAEGGNVFVLRFLIERGIDPWCRTSIDETLLHRACIHGKLEMIKYLVETYPKMLHEVDNGKNTPAHHAAAGGNVAVLSYLIDHGADPWCRTSDDETLLHRACIHGKLEMTKYLVETYPKMLHEFDNSMKTPSYHAAYGGNVDILSYLVERGIDPWYRTSDEETVLHRACFYGKLEMTKFLVETYPKMLHEVDNGKRTAAHYAASGGNVVVLCYLIDRGTDPWCKTSDDETLLHRACIDGKLEMIKYLVETYPKMLHEVDNGNRTPAHHAAACDSVAVLSYLIDRGTDPWCRTSDDETLLHIACIHGKLEMTKYLVKTYPKMLHEVDNCTRTPAHHAAEGGNVDILSYLVERGIDPWCRTSDEETVLHRACVTIKLEMTKYLVETYPKMLYEVDNGKRTPVHHAAAGGNVAVLRYLIDCGIDPWSRTSDDETLLHRACIYGKLDMTKFLVETYPKMLHEVANGNRTPAHSAAAGGNVAVLRYLIDRGIDPWCRTSDDETLLHRSCIHCKLEMTKFLVETYPKMLHEVANGIRTPAHSAAAGGNVAVLRYLIDCGIDPWSRTSDDETLLHRACIYGKLDMTKFLVETYPKMLHEVANGNRTPAHSAAAGGNVAVLRYLIDRGIDPWCRTSDDETLLHRSCIHCKLEMTKFLVETYPKMLHEVDKVKRTPADHAEAGGNVAVLNYLIDRGTDPLCRTSDEETLY